jgi:antitoxin component YwqK of YwqJK toxin-antitoxin module
MSHDVDFSANSSGKAAERGSYKRTGSWTMWDEAGKVTKQTRFKNAVPVKE